MSPFFGLCHAYRNLSNRCRTWGQECLEKCTVFGAPKRRRCCTPPRASAEPLRCKLRQIIETPWDRLRRPGSGGPILEQRRGVFSPRGAAIASPRRGLKLDLVFGEGRSEALPRQVRQVGPEGDRFQREQRGNEGEVQFLVPHDSALQVEVGDTRLIGKELPREGCRRVVSAQVGHEVEVPAESTSKFRHDEQKQQVVHCGVCAADTPATREEATSDKAKKLPAQTVRAAHATVPGCGR
mmetsp:Transcript_31891/g.88153  ORF Transcript_31891/g.88153 Transcript_31891/m.88153 type:complete len:239 (+) Transcript_31891:733-1449(+)